MAVQFGSYLTIVIFRGFHHEPPLPGPLLVLVYTWHVFVLPLWLAIWTSSLAMPRLVSFVARRVRRLPNPTAQVPESGRDACATGSAAPSRRDLIRAGVTAIPPVAGVFTAAYALRQQELFEVIKLDVPVAGLPDELDGLRIAHVSDPHVGKFTSSAKLREITQAVNDLNVDLVAVTGDLIDHWMGVLDDGIALVRSFRSRNGTFLCEGNHDLMEDHDGFESLVRKAGLRLLLNESAMLQIRGRKVQMLGIRWGRRKNLDAMYAEHFAATLPLRDPAAFPILIAHHPHTFDPAAEAGLPLVLCGHTHGGQIMLTRSIGPARILYKYLSGLYRRDGTSLVVSNGVGNWFPLRINAPAQLAELTLRRASA
ncbi:MAG: metallophosphoesterase [Tepidisphaerales bacterium]